MIIITLPDYINKIQNSAAKGAQWCYIGKDILLREDISRRLGQENRFYIADRIHKIAMSIREPFLDFIADLGKFQGNQLGWWASRLASKSPFQTDFLLLLCYKILVSDLIKEKSDRPLLIIVEDPWLFTDLKSDVICEDVKFIGYGKLAFKQISCLMRGLIYRVLLAGWLIVAKLLVRLYHDFRKPEVLFDKNSAIGIVNPAEKRAFCGRDYVENYMPGLGSFYKEKEVSFFYIYPALFPLQTLRQIGLNQRALWPLIIEVKVTDIFKRIFQFWNPVLSDRKKRIPYTLNGYDIMQFFKRERWFEFSSAGFNMQLISFDAFNHFFKKKWCSCVIYPFENQPWEKMLCMAAKENQVRLVGYQHSSISRLYISQFIGKGESSFVPLPSEILTSGSFSAQLLKEGGMPNDRITVGGAWRYQHILNRVSDNLIVREKNSPNDVVLVSLPLDLITSKSILQNLHKAVSHSIKCQRLKFWVKPHPGVDEKMLHIIKDMSGGCQIVNEPLGELLDKISFVISSSSTSSLEAFLYGKGVISYIPENLIPTDPVLDIEDERIYKWYDGTELDVNFLTSNFNGESISADNKYFGRINYGAWLKCVNS